MRRCVSSGRLPATCTGNFLLGTFGQMLSSVMPSSATRTPAAGPDLAGVFQGPGNWRLDFIDGGVLVNCASLAPNQQSYTLNLAGAQPTLTIDTTPRPLVLTLHADNSMSGPGPVTIEGVINTGALAKPDPNASSGYTDRNGMNLSNSQAATAGSVYQNGQIHYGPLQPAGAPRAVFSHRRVTCPALNLSSKGAGPGIQTMQTDLLKSVFNDGEKGPPTPAGIRMHGIFAASTGFSAQFFPESVLLGCGPDAARAYPYTVVPAASGATIRIDAPDHPLALAFVSGGGLNPGTGPYQVHGRIVTGQDDDDNFTFAPLEQTCNLPLLTPSAAIPSSATLVANAPAPGSSPATVEPAGPRAPGAALSTPAAPTGPAVLSISSGLSAAVGAPNPLGLHPYVLLRDSLDHIVASAGLAVPAGSSSYKFLATTCAARTPDCLKLSAAIQASAASAARSDPSGAAALPGVPPGTYYVMISARFNNQMLVWPQPVHLNPGPNPLTLSTSNAIPVQ